MAGDWIKMRVDLGDDPAVVQIAAALDISEDEVVGKLHRLWAWADRHTTDGTAPAITAKWVDRYVAMGGFAEAMISTGWISFSEAGVAFPGFERHNGDSAKRRVEATLRQRLSRKNRDDGVTGDTRTPIPRPFVRHVMERDNHTCVYCGLQSSAAQESGKRKLLSVDHIKPIARGGSAAVENLACCCKLCNSEKADRTPEEWGLIPGFLQPGLEYKDGILVSQKNCDTSVTREEKRRDQHNTHCAQDSAAPSEMTLDWVPDAKLLKAFAVRVGIPVEAFTDEAIAPFVCHYQPTGRCETQAAWVSLLVRWFKTDAVRQAASNVKAFPVRRAAGGDVDFDDTGWLGGVQ